MHYQGSISVSIKSRTNSVHKKKTKDFQRERKARSLKRLSWARNQPGVNASRALGKNQTVHHQPFSSYSRFNLLIYDESHVCTGLAAVELLFAAQSCMKSHFPRNKAIKDVI
jgi:hypothetical protein